MYTLPVRSIRVLFVMLFAVTAAAPAMADDALSLLFIGNSFTHQGPIPDLVSNLATDTGWATPNTQYVAPGGVTLGFHSTNPDTLNAIDLGGWDFVILQDYSTRPTDNAGDPLGFKTDATFLYDRVKTSSPDAQVLLYETWARHPDHAIYPVTFTDPAQMQAQLRLHYNDAADNYIPTNSTALVKTDVTVAHVGDAWESYLDDGGTIRLHGTDDYHAGTNGQYLNALVLYSMIYGRSVDGLTSLNIAPADAAVLQGYADATTGKTTPGGPGGTLPDPLDPGATILIDFGSETVTSSGTWNNMTNSISGTAINLIDDTGVVTAVDAAVTDGFVGVNSQGIAGNTLGYPGTASSDTFWTGSFNSHADALNYPAQVTLSGLGPDSEYDITLFAARTGDDSGNGRLTRYTVAGQWQDLEVSDNTDTHIVFESVSPQPDGSLTIDVIASEAGTSRFGYLGLMKLTSLAVELAGDLNNDGFVGVEDLNIVLGNWNQSVPPGDVNADPSGDGYVGIEDLNMVLGNWNAGTPPGSHVTIPEPASLMWFCTLLLYTRRCPI
jgi:hypothetical protein